MRGLVWNKDHLDSAGIDSNRSPETLGELEDYATRLTVEAGDGRVQQLGFAPWIGNWGLQGWFWSFGGDVYDRERRKPVVNTEANREAANWIREFAQRLGAQAVQFPRGRGEFTSGLRSMGIEANVTYEQFRQTVPDLRLGVGAVPHAEGGKNGTWSGGYAHVVPVGSEHVAEAVTFLNFLNKPSMQVRQFEVTGGLPTGTAAFHEVLTERHDENRLAFLEQLPVSNGRPPLWLAVHLALAASLGEIVADEKSPEQALVEVQQHMENQFAEIMGW